MKQNTQDWREKFDKEFKYFYPDDGAGRGAIDAEPGDLKDFISNLLTAQLTDLVEELEGMKKEIPKNCACDSTRCIWHIQYGSYNQTVSDIQNLIKNKIENK